MGQFNDSIPGLDTLLLLLLDRSRRLHTCRSDMPAAYQDETPEVRIRYSDLYALEAFEEDQVTC